MVEKMQRPRLQKRAEGPERLSRSACTGYDKRRTAASVADKMIVDNTSRLKYRVDAWGSVDAEEWTATSERR